jgi:hypothetical protein
LGLQLALRRPCTREKYAIIVDDGLNLYLNARADPSPTNVEKLAAQIHGVETREIGGIYGWAIQALGEFNQIESVLGWIARTPTGTVAQNAYLFFRPASAGLRKDPRFMQVAKRIGLVDYWRSSGKWPDFCQDPSVPYDCKAEAAKLG